MRIAGLILSIAALACNSATGARPVPSITGQWSATDATQREMVLVLMQTGDSVNGTGYVSGVTTLRAVGHNIPIPPCCGPSSPCPPCALAFPVWLTIVDPAGDTLVAPGGTLGADTLDLYPNKPSKGFPFSRGTITLARAVLDR